MWYLILSYAINFYVINGTVCYQLIHISFDERDNTCASSYDNYHIENGIH